MSRLDPAIGRRRERVVGGIVVLVGVAVLVLSIVALVVADNDPASDVAGPTVTLPGGSVSASTSRSASTTPTAPTTSGSTSASTSATTSPSTSASTSPPAAAAGSQPLVVLNNTSQSGLAQQAANTFTRGGWTVTDTANWSQSTISTCAYYDPDVAGAQAAATALMQQFPAIKRTAVKYGALPSGPVVVVLTSDYTAQ